MRTLVPLSPFPVDQGDYNLDGSIDVGDVVALLDFLSGDGPAPQLQTAGDANRDGSIDVGDVVFLLQRVSIR